MPLRIIDALSVPSGAVNEDCVGGEAALAWVIDAATDGPWESDDTGLVETTYSVHDREDVRLVIAVPPATATGAHDAEFIAAARTGWPRALDRIAKLEAENQRLRDGIIESMDVRGAIAFVDHINKLLRLAPFGGCEAVVGVEVIGDDE